MYMKDLISKDKVTVRIKGHEVDVNLLTACGHEILVTGRFFRLAKLKDEWYNDAGDALSLINALMSQGFSLDIFTFIQRPPDCSPKYNYYTELDNVAAIPLKDYDYWWQKQITSKTRALVRKAQKCGICVKIVEFDDNLLRGIEDIYNETPVRQGKPFWHYKKDLEYLKRVHETFPERSDFLGAYYNEELVGFVKLVYAGATANTMHIISKNSHRDKSVTNALIAKAVERSCEKECTYLAYDKFDYGTGGSPSLLLFKRNNGFIKVEFPRYYVPLTKKGRIAIRLRLHHGVLPLLPKWMIEVIFSIRSKWYQYKYGIK
jgi:FemAB family